MNYLWASSRWNRLESWHTFTWCLCNGGPSSKYFCGSGDHSWDVRWYGGDVRCSTFRCSHRGDCWWLGYVNGFHEFALRLDILVVLPSMELYWILVLHWLFLNVSTPNSDSCTIFQVKLGRYPTKNERPAKANSYMYYFSAQCVHSIFRLFW